MEKNKVVSPDEVSCGAFPGKTIVSPGKYTATKKCTSKHLLLRISPQICYPVHGMQQSSSNAGIRINYLGVRDQLPEP